MPENNDYHSLRMPDGRILHLYGPWEGKPEWPHLALHPRGSSHARWHPLRQEWVVYAAARQNRTYKPAANACPLCPHSPEGELPLGHFTVAVFDNKFSSLHVQNETPPDLSSYGIPTHPAKGACEVIVYSSDHVGNLATIAQANRELLLKVWGLRRRELLQNESINFVMPFENRGEEAGVTLHHPHGQIYAFGELPPVLERMAPAFKNGFSLQDTVKRCTSQIVFETDEAVAFVPPFTRYPYEIWLTTKTFHAASDELSGKETTAAADLLRRTVLLYDRFFDRPCPYMMIVYMAPKGYEDCFPFHIQFYPLLRSKERMKYLAGCEQGAGTFLVDVLPEAAAAELRKVGEQIS